MSEKNATGVIVDNFLTDTVDSSSPVNLCTRGNPQLPSRDGSCFSSAPNTTLGRPANTAYQGVGMIIVPNVVGTHRHTFRITDVGVVGANNKLLLQTECRVTGG